MASTFSNSDIKNINWAKDDPRSVKYQLDGKGSIRAAWWSLFGSIFHFFNPKATTEQVMFAFHSIHHRITLYFTRASLDARWLHKTIRNDGVGAALKGVAADLKAEWARR